MNTDADIIIVGGGGAGLAAAVAAAESGCKKVIVLEKRGATGGTSAMASGIFGADSPAQRRQAIQAPKDEMFQRFMQWAHLSVNPRIIRAFVNLSGDTIRWLEDKGLYFMCRSHSPADNPMTWHVPDGNGAEIMKVLAGECRKLGVEIVLHAVAKKLQQEENGDVTGVTADVNGMETVFHAGRVIIASGGFGGNMEWVEKACPKFVPGMVMSGVPNQGEGIAMALEAGAAPDGLGLLMAAGPVAGGGGVLKVGEAPDVVPVSLTFITGEPATIWVNTKGRRFIDETAIFNYYEAINALLRQPEGICYALFDAALVRSITMNGLTNVAAGYHYGEKQRSPLPGGLERELAAIADGIFMKIAGSWEEIAGWLQVEWDVLEAEIQGYNTGCERGYDAVFGKNRRYLQPLQEPPYYAIRCIPVALNTMGGIKVNEHMEVLDNRDNPISGLYAAGVDTGGWTPDTYCAALPGTAFGYAINSGRIAGTRAASAV